MIKMEEIDKLNLYRGRPYIINQDIQINVPKLGDICDYGEINYYSMVNSLCSVGLDLCWQLEEIGIKFDEISDFNLFRMIISKLYTKDQTRILFGDKIDFSQMKSYTDKDGKIFMMQVELVNVPLKNQPKIAGEHICNIAANEPIEIIEAGQIYSKVRYKNNIGYILSCHIGKKDGRFIIADSTEQQALNDGVYSEIIIDENIYLKMIACIRDMHGLERNNAVAGSSHCRAAFIEDAKMAYEDARHTPRKSILLPLISTMVNIEGFKRNDMDVWDMNIFAFMDSVKRIGRIRNASLLLQSAYSGFGIDINKIKNKDELDYMGELK